MSSSASPSCNSMATEFYDPGIPEPPHVITVVCNSTRPWNSRASSCHVILWPWNSIALEFQSLLIGKDQRSQVAVKKVQSPESSRSTYILRPRRPRFFITTCQLAHRKGERGAVPSFSSADKKISQGRAKVSTLLSFSW